jgi:hypothetical protein
MTIKVTYFDVSGRGRFPYDMLRYDRCWPTREFETPKLSGYSAENITIGMAGYSMPTVDRWKSFGWLVSNVRKGM